MNKDTNFLRVERFYKFLDARFLASYFQDETLLMSSNTYYAENYAAMEIKNPHIFDPYEGSAIRVQTRPITERTTNKNELSVLRKISRGLADNLSEHSNVFLEGNVFVETIAQFHMLCYHLRCARGDEAHLL
jgi:hypothetical protein